MGRPKICNPCCGGVVVVSSSSSRRVTPASSSSSSSFSGSTIPGPTCCLDNISSARYQFTISGAANVGCSVCNAYNGTWIVTKSGSEYRSSNFIACPYGIGGSDNEWRWRMTMQCLTGPTRLRVNLQTDPFHFPAAPVVVYQADFLSPYDCLTTFPLSKLSEPGTSCNGFPSSVDVVAI